MDWVVHDHKELSLVLLGMLDFPGGSVVKNLPAIAGDSGLISGSGRSLGEGNGNCSSILAWRIAWTEEPGGLQSLGIAKSQTWLSN